MSTRQYRQASVDSVESCRLIFYPVAELPESFRKRRDEVQAIMIRMILLGQKKGRPSTKEEAYEKAA